MSMARNLAIEYHLAENQIDRLPALAADLARRQVSIIAAGGSPASALVSLRIAVNVCRICRLLWFLAIALSCI
jgi:hypothetical protein